MRDLQVNVVGCRSPHGANIDGAVVDGLRSYGIVAFTVNSTNKPITNMILNFMTTSTIAGLYTQVAPKPLFLSGFKAPPQNHFNTEAVELDIERDSQ